MSLKVKILPFKIMPTNSKSVFYSFYLLPFKVTPTYSKIQHGPFNWSPIKIIHHIAPQFRP